MKTSWALPVLFLVTVQSSIAIAQASTGGSGEVEEAAAGEVKGVNPADVLSRADLIVKAVNLPVGESLVMVAKYDQKLGQGLGANVELPIASYVNVGTASAFGIGDLFARIRYVKPLSRDIIALASAEVAVPTATNDLLGTGKWQLNPGVGLVKIWSPKTFTALVYKHSFSIAGDSARASINANSMRLVQTFVLNRGFYVTADARHEWTGTGPKENWTTGEFEVGKQFNAKFAASMRIGKAFGDRRNDGSIDFNVRTFF